MSVARCLIGMATVVLCDSGGRLNVHAEIVLQSFKNWCNIYNTSKSPCSAKDERARKKCLFEHVHMF